jgi:hypothetical protein
MATAEFQDTTQITNLRVIKFGFGVDEENPGLLARSIFGIVTNNISWLNALYLSNGFNLSYFYFVFV